MNSTANDAFRNVQSATAQIIPFRFDAREVRTLLVEDQPWFCAADVCSVLGYANSRDALAKHCREKGVSKRDTLSVCDVAKRDASYRARRSQSMTFIDEGNLYRLIIKSRKEEAQRFEAWVCDEVLPSIRKHGRYEDSDNLMATLVGQTIGTDGFHMLGALIKGKVSSLPTPAQRRATAKIWSQTHAAFGVRSAADIPAGQLDAARNFIAAYSVMEGEWLPKEDHRADIPRPLGRDQRYLVYLDSQGIEQAKEIPSGSYVLTYEGFLNALLVHGDLPASTDDMFRFVDLAMKNLQRRSAVCLEQMRNMRRQGGRAAGAY